VWAVFLDSDFINSGRNIFGGKNIFSFKTKFPVERNDEIWVLCGSSEPFLLRGCSGGYRVVGPVLCLNLRLQPFLGMSGLLDKYTDESGDLDPSKMERRRIAIF
jgi:hypothetical protein